MGMERTRDRIAQIFYQRCFYLFVARMLVVTQQIAGVLYVAMLIARLAGAYPPRQQGRKGQGHQLPVSSPC